MLTTKERKPLKVKDIVKLEELQLRYPGDLSVEEQTEKDKLIERRNNNGT